MEPTTVTVTRLLGGLYDAAATPELWPEFLQDLRQTGNADKAYVLAVGPDSRVDLSIQLGFDATALADYARHFVNADPILDGFEDAQAVHGDWIGNSESVLPDNQLHRSELFNDFMKPNGVAYHCGATLSGLAPGTVAGICMLRTEHAGIFEPEMIALLTILAPHVKRALTLHKTLQVARMEGALLRQSMETVDLAIISVDCTGQLLNITRAAQNILDTRDGLVLEGKSLRALIPAERRRLSDLISGAAATGSGSRNPRIVHCSAANTSQAGNSAHWTPASGGAILISRRSPKRPLQVVVTPFHSSNTFLDAQPSALVFLSDPDATPASRSSIMRTLYGLSPTECRLTDLLAAGNELATAADRQTMTVQTARFHLKSIFRKTGTNRQTDLVRLILGLPGMV
jgi:DNA-binding CsgD family transcriptional regulator